MAMMQKIKELFEPADQSVEELIVPAPPTKYSCEPLTNLDTEELMRLSLRCFSGTEAYNRATFEFLLGEPKVLGYKVVTASGMAAGFLFVMANHGNIAHITTIAVAPEHRKRGLARKLLDFAEKALIAKGIESVVLEVRVSNFGAQNLYSRRDYVIIQKLLTYYSDGEDAFLMSKSLIA